MSPKGRRCHTHFILALNNFDSTKQHVYLAIGQPVFNASRDPDLSGLVLGITNKR